MTLRVVNAAPYYPVSLAEARLWCKIDDAVTADDSLLTMLIAAMTSYAENLTLRAFIARDLQLVLPGWPVAARLSGVPWTAIELPYPPLLSLNSIQYRDSTGTYQTLATTQYVVHDWREPAVVVPAYNVAWPGYRADLDAVKVNFVAGYSQSDSPPSEAGYQANVPKALKLWMHARISTLYNNRDQLIAATQGQMPRDLCDGLLDDLRVGTRIAG